MKTKLSRGEVPGTSFPPLFVCSTKIRVITWVSLVWTTCREANTVRYVTVPEATDTASLDMMDGLSNHTIMRRGFAQTVDRN